jgi:hypothetical protein
MKGTKKEPHSHPRTVKPFSEEILSMQRYCIEEKRFMGGMQLVSSACPSAIYDSTFNLKKQAFSYCFNWISIVS